MRGRRLQSGERARRSHLRAHTVRGPFPRQRPLLALRTGGLVRDPAGGGAGVRRPAQPGGALLLVVALVVGVLLVHQRRRRRAVLEWVRPVLWRRGRRSATRGQVPLERAVWMLVLLLLQVPKVLPVLEGRVRRSKTAGSRLFGCPRRVHSLLQQRQRQRPRLLQGCRRRRWRRRWPQRRRRRHTEGRRLVARNQQRRRRRRAKRLRHGLRTEGRRRRWRLCSCHRGCGGTIKVRAGCWGRRGS